MVLPASRNSPRIVGNWRTDRCTISIPLCSWALGISLLPLCDSRSVLFPGIHGVSQVVQLFLGFSAAVPYVPPTSSLPAACHPCKMIISPRSRKSLNTLFTNLWKTAGAFFNPNGILRYSYCPCGVTNAVYFRDRSATLTWWNPLFRSSNVKNFFPPKYYTQSSISGSG